MSNVTSTPPAPVEPPRRFRHWAVLLAALFSVSLLSSAWFSENTTKPIFKQIVRALEIEMRPSQIQRTHTGLRKLAHFSEYFALSAVAFWTFRGGRPRRWRWHWAVAALMLAVTYSLLDEWHQSLLVERTGTLRDSVIDIAGAAAAQILIAARAAIVATSRHRGSSLGMNRQETK